MTPDRLRAVLARIDQLNSEDPTTELVDNVPRPRELAYSQRLTDWVLRLDPGASDALRIAARGQHVCRWTIPRSRYEPGRRGYLRWRETLKAFHARTVADLMREEGCGEEEISRVSQIILKQHLSEPETQTMEDALCLVFFETQFSDLRRKTEPEKMRDVLRKMWQKMSANACAQAQRMAMGSGDRACLEEAVR